MTTLDSSSAAAESSMDEGGSSNRLQTLSKTNSFNTTANNGQSPDRFFNDSVGQEEEAEKCDGGDAEVWGAFAESFRQVQSVLDRNRLLIQQVNENHQSKIHDNMVKNIALIQEINGNISKVVSLYSDLSTNFSSLFRQRNTSVDAKNSDERQRR